MLQETQTTRTSDGVVRGCVDVNSVCVVQGAFNSRQRFGRWQLGGT